jgi:hypothetical protein
MRETTTPAAPASAACPMKSCASKLSPRSATNSDPASIVRVSVEMPE